MSLRAGEAATVRVASPDRWPWRFATALGLLIACGGDAPRSPPEGGATQTTLTILSTTPNVRFGNQYFTPWKFLLFEPLVWFDAQGETVPRLATSWEHSPDYREWRYHLRSDVRWHDGAPFTARDVKFTVELFGRPDILYYADLEDVSAPDDTTVIIRTRLPTMGPDWFTVYYPEHLLSGLDPDEIWEWDFWARPVGNGPFRFGRSVPMTLWEMEANRDYYVGRPAIDRVRIRFGGGNPLVQLRSGLVDVVPDFEEAWLAGLDSDPRFRTYFELPPDDPSFDAIWWNHAHPFLGAAEVRRALTHAIDRHELRRLRRVPDLVPVADVPFTRRQLLRGGLPAPLAFDPDRARRLLEGSGWRDSDGDGIRERGGVQASFTALTGGDATAAVYVQAALRRIGVQMHIRTLVAVRPQVHTGAFEAAFDRFIPSRPTWQEETGYVNERTQRLLAAAASTGDLTSVDDLYRQTWPDFMRDVPLTLLGHQIWPVVAHRRVRGLGTPFRANPYHHARDLWIEERGGPEDPDRP